MVPAFIRVANKLWSSLGAKVSLVAQLVKNLLVKRPWFDSWVRNIPWRRDRLPTPTFLGFPGGSEWETEFDSWFGKIPWRREWQHTPVFLPEEFHRQRSLAGYSSWHCKESDATFTYTKKWKKYPLKESVERTKEGTLKAFSQCVFTSIPHKHYLQLLCLKER